MGKKDEDTPGLGEALAGVVQIADAFDRLVALLEDLADAIGLPAVNGPAPRDVEPEPEPEPEPAPEPDVA